MPKLMQLAKVVRSKNAGPYWLTMDIMFHDQITYDRVRRSGVITEDLISRLYKVDPEKVAIYLYDPAYAIKITVPRPVASGDILDTDVYATQQHAPLLTIEVPEEVKDR